MTKLIKEYKFILLILLSGLGMRLVVLNQSFWLDEAIGVEAIYNFSYRGLIFEFLKFDNHPPLYYILLKLWASLFGYSEAALRVMSVIFGVVTIFITYKIAKDISKNVFFAPTASLLLATSQFHVYYSQEVRVYPLITLLAGFSILIFFRLVTKKDRPYLWVLFALSLVTLLFTDYITVFLFPFFWIWGFLKKKGVGWWLKFLFSHIPLLILGLLWLPMFVIQAEKGRWLLSTLPAWRKVAGGATFKQAILVWTKYAVGRISLANKSLYYFIIIIGSIPVASALANSLRKRATSVNFIWLWFLTPLVLGFVSSLAFPAFIYFRFMYVLPAFYLLISWGISKVENVRLRIVLVVSILVINSISWGIYILDKNQQREDWKGAVSYVEASAALSEIALFEYNEPFTPYRWYSTGIIPEIGATDSISANLRKTQEITGKAIDGKSGVYYFEYLRDLSDPARVVEAVLKNEGYEISDVRGFSGVGNVYHWVKK